MRARVCISFTTPRSLRVREIVKVSNRLPIPWSAWGKAVRSRLTRDCRIQRPHRLGHTHNPAPKPSPGPPSLGPNGVTVADGTAYYPRRVDREPRRPPELYDELPICVELASGHQRKQYTAIQRSVLLLGESRLYRSHFADLCGEGRCDGVPSSRGLHGHRERSAKAWTAWWDSVSLYVWVVLGRRGDYEEGA